MTELTAARTALLQPRWAVCAALWCAVVLVAAFLPVLAVKVPVMIDYPNHLSRMYVIARAGADPSLARFYDVEWKIVPNLAAEAIVPLLARSMDIFAAGKLFILASMALIVSGSFAIHAALYRRLGLWVFVSLLFLYNFVFLFGFLNYLFAVGLALWASAAWIWLRERSPGLRGAISALFVLAIFACHFMGVALYGLAIFAYEAWRLRNAPPRSRTELAREVAALVVPFLLAVLLLAASPTSQQASETEWQLWPEKLNGIYFLVKGYDVRLDALYATALAVTAAWGLWTRRLVLHPAAVIFCLAAALVYFGVPFKLMNAGYVDTRLPAAYVFFLIGMSRWKHRSAASAATFAGSLAFLVLARSAVIGAYWISYTGALAEYERSFQAIPPGSRVMAANSVDWATRWTDRMVTVNFPVLVTLERSSLESHLFSDPSKQPIVVREPYRRAVPVDTDRPIELGDLRRADETSDLPQPIAYLKDWRRNYDYLYVRTSTPDAATPPLSGLELLYRGRDFQLYRIARPDTAAGDRTRG